MTLDVFCFPDSNFFFHYQHFADVDWLEMLGSHQAHVVIARPVLQELDKHKNNEGKVRDRARKVVRTIEEMLAGADPGAPVKFAVKCDLRVDMITPEMGKYRGRLESQSNDDKLLAHALEYSERPGSHVIVLSGDIALRLKAKQLGLVAMEPPQSLRRALPSTAAEKELARLKRTVANIRSSFVLDGTPYTNVIQKLPILKLSPDRLEAATEKRRSELLSASRARGGWEYRFPHEEAQIDGYVPGFRQYLLNRNAYLEYVERFIQLPLALFNEAVVPAEDVVLDVELISEGTVLVEPGFPEPAGEPQLPQFALRRGLRLSSPPPTHRWPMPVQSTWERLGPGLVRWRTIKLLHGILEPLAPLVALVPKFEDASLSLRCSTHAANSPDRSEQILQLDYTCVDFD